MTASFWSVRLHEGQLVVGRSRTPIDNFLDGLKQTIFVEHKDDLDHVGVGALVVGLGRVAGRNHTSVARFAERLASRGAAGLMIHERSIEPGERSPRAAGDSFPVLTVPRKLDWTAVLQPLLHIDSLLKDRSDNPEKRRRDALMLLINSYGQKEPEAADAKAIGLDLETSFTSVVVVPNDKLESAALNKIEEIIALEAMESDPLATVFPWQGSVVVVGDPAVFYPSEGSAAARLLFKVRKEISPIDAIVGVGRPHSTAHGIFRSFREARWAARVARFETPPKNVMAFDEVGSYAWLEPMDFGTNGEAVSEISRLIEHDRRSGTQLVHTLQVYLQASRSKQAANELFVHRNTLRYRLESIKKLTGLDLREHEARLILELQLRLARVRGLLGPHAGATGTAPYAEV
ncbi:MAG: PucR family transcriptional regulator, purine catabolism regulatory protein [Actinomycetota bacterium]|jgi:sugar diacid utilization regulator|nr:PucR family transcriptional regulator, purine catabolism regulatory protein [Actinomycetota bacterium]